MPGVFPSLEAPVLLCEPSKEAQRSRKLHCSFKWMEGTFSELIIHVSELISSTCWVCVFFWLLMGLPVTWAPGLTEERTGNLELAELSHLQLIQGNTLEYIYFFSLIIAFQKNNIYWAFFFLKYSINGSCPHYIDDPCSGNWMGIFVRL